MPREKRAPVAGDYFLMPFAGRQRDVLVRVVGSGFGGHHTCVYPAHPDRGETNLLLSSCARVSPARAARILGVSVTGPATDYEARLRSYHEARGVPPQTIERLVEIARADGVKEDRSV